ncbi:Inositol-1-monophosphatase [Streptococcus sp. DD10]|uniref:inositol monophosphatase family protein n=1 Tax=Streptococcus sp. DD10 TaxID=1777878 RepID=UPI000793B16C|nr:inositol monophosphatase family protein [Streptococcus sp. DD10]KXT75256.1 Inositol-1-monophosphatase [Streptococcus sp. DD10]
MSLLEIKFNFAKKMVVSLGSYLLENIHNDLIVEEKSSPTDLVTNMDNYVQNRMVEEIQSSFPGDTILAEENNLTTSIWEGNTWVIDPIDGTANFITQKQDFAIMVAYFEGGVGRFGLIYDVTKNLLYHGGGDFPSMVNNRLLPVFNKEKQMQQSLIASNAGMYRKNYRGIADLVDHSLSLRVYGSAGISFSHILSGRLWAYFSTLSPWDYAAASILGESLGYLVLTLSGAKPDFINREEIMMVPKEKMNEIMLYIKKDE